MGWFFLIFAGMFEIVGVVGMNQINKAKNIRAFVIFIVGIVMSFAFLSQAMKACRWVRLTRFGQGLGRLEVQS